MNVDPSTPILLSPRDAARLLAISERSLDRLRERGELPSLVVANRLRRYRLIDLQAWAEARLVVAEKGGRS
jgi:predicted DNA-binding transcriptional regulator AlpA